MKKISFNDKFGFTQAVIEGRKTMKREIVGNYKYALDVFRYYDYISKSKYNIHETVAISQNYKDAGYEIHQYTTESDKEYGYLRGLGYDEIPMKWPIRGYTNKMFAKAELMPYQIYITAIYIEKLQDISDEDCLKEGVIECKDCNPAYCYLTKRDENFYCGHAYTTPQAAFANIIDETYGKGTWNSNPYVIVYTFNLIKYHLYE